MVAPRVLVLTLVLAAATLASIGLLAVGAQMQPASGQSDQVLYLTFDDGPSNEFTWSILDALDEYDAKATFFPVGARFRGTEDLVRSIASRGHQIGNHTINHPNLVSVSDGEVRSELEEANEAIATLVGVVPTCWRPPAGSSDGRVDGIAAGLGLEKVLWNRGGNDFGLTSGQEFLDRVRDSRSGDIILLHDSAGPNTVDATRLVLEHFTEQGFRFETVPQCRALTPATTTIPPTTTITTVPPTTTTTSTTTTTTTTTLPPEPVSDAPIAIRARGTTGSEIIKLKVNRKVVAAFTLSTGLRDYQYSPRTSTKVNTIQVFFVNDGDQNGKGRDVEIDFVSVNGRVFEAEHPEVKSKGAWVAGAGCSGGFHETELLACKGWFRFKVPNRTRIEPAR